MIALADCAVSVSDAEKSAEWWSRALGFAVHRVGTGSHAVMVAPPGDKFVLHLCQGFEPVQPGNSGIAFMTDDIAALTRRMRAGGVEFPEPLARTSRSAMAKFADPDGNVFWLIEAPAAFVRREARRRAPHVRLTETPRANRRRAARRPRPASAS